MVRRDESDMIRAGMVRSAGVWRCLHVLVLFLAVITGVCAVKVSPALADDNGLLVMADNTLANGDLPTALKLYRQAATANGGSSQALIRYGQVLFGAGQYDFAAGAFAEALHREPWNREAMTGLGVAQMADGRLDEAQDNLEQVVRKTADARSVRNLVVLRLLQGQIEEARLLQEKAVKRWPQDLDLRANFGLSEALDNRCDSGVGMVHDAVASPFARGQHAAMYALALALCGREDEARDTARQVMSEAGVEHLLQQATAARQVDDPASRIVAVGLVPLANAGVMAPAPKPARRSP